jgi:signal transduction histidine kinase
LFWRIYLQGLLLIVVVGATAFALMRWSSQDPARSPLIGLQKLAIATLPPDHPPDLDQLYAILEADIAVYDDRHALLAARTADGSAPPEPLSDGAYEDLRASAVPTRSLSGGLHIHVALEGRRYLILRWPNDRSAIAHVLALAGLLGVCALVMLPLARAIARPLEKIASTASALGQGDLSARTHIQRSDEIGSLAASFDQMADRLQHLITGEKELLANVSHELRTPLTRLRLALTLMEDDPAYASSPLPDYLPGIQEDVTQLQDLVDEILSAARLALAQGTTPSLPIQRQPLSLPDLLALASSRFLQRHPHAPLRLPPAPPPITLSGDANLLCRLLVNLLENAAKYASPTPDQPITLSATFDPATATVSLCVRDHGPGVPPHLRYRIFDPFFRADPARSDVPGSGLGLTLCKRIAEAHGGAITAASPPDGGLLICATLPAVVG